MWTGAGAINREPHLQGSCLEKASLLVVGPPGQGASPSCSSDALSLFLSLSLPWPWPLSAPSPFSALLCLLLSRSAARKGAPRGGAEPGAGAQAPWSLRAALIFTLLPALLPCSGQSVLPFVLELPAPKGAGSLASSPQPLRPLLLSREAGQQAGPWGGHRARTRVLAPGRTRALAAEPHRPGPTLLPEVPGASRRQGSSAG